MAISPLEDRPEILQKIGLFIVLFNIIDADLGIEFYYLVSQSDTQKRPVLDFLISQDFSKKLDILKLILGSRLHSEIKKINEFRNFISHGMHGMSTSGKISISKMKRGTRRYDSINIDENTLDEYIQKEKAVLVLFHELTLKRMQR